MTFKDDTFFDKQPSIMIASIVNIDGHELWNRPPKTPFQELGGEHCGVAKVWSF